MRSQPGAVAEIDVQARERLQVARVLQATRIDGLEPHALGQLVELLPEYRSIELGIYAIYPTRKHVALKVRALIDFLAQQFSVSRSF